MDNKIHRMKPSELLHAFSTAKVKAARHVTSRIIDFVNAGDHTSNVTSTVPLHKPLFEPTPAEVWIDDYTPFHPVTIKLSFRNCDSVARRLKIEPPKSPWFKVLPWTNKSCSQENKIDGKIAAGMEKAFQLEFSPQEIREYAEDLICCTERERFLLPIRVRGRYAALDIPDEIDFGLCPVKMTTQKVLTVRNVGSRGAKFAFKTSENFHITPSSVVLEQGGVVQLELSILPPTLTTREGELAVTDDAGQVAVVHLHGKVANVDVYLSQPIVEPSPSYISLSSRKTIKICNESEFTLEFCWKAFADITGEELERDRLLEELARMENAELEQLIHDPDQDSYPLSSSQSPFDTRKTIENKYKQLRKATMEDAMQFVNECFSLVPIKGRVWAHSEVDVVVCFSPAIALQYSCCAYLEISGQESRLPLQIRGRGIGPKAKVVYNELLDFADVFINDERTRDFTIQNKGEIPAEFELVPISMAPGIVLDVQPSAGTLEVNAMRKVEVTFCSHQLGQAFYPIHFSLRGSEEQLIVRLKANVIPPIFHFDTDQIDFGAVSYSFPQTKTLKLINASKIAIKYSLKIPEEANYKQKEFELFPVHGKLDAFGEQEVRINFTSCNVKTYEYHLVVGVAGIGSDLLSIPIKAQCFVPDIVVQQPQELDFGACFLRYPHTQTLVLENKSSHLYGRFEIGEQDDHSRAIATYNASEFSGTIPPEERAAVDIYLSCEKLGSIRLPMAVTIPGSTDLPLAVTLTAVGTGPKVELDQTEINLGNCMCLVDHERILRMTNTSLIPAHFKTFIRNARSKFQIDKKEGTLPPGESVEFVLIANLDDTILFKDQLHILITEGENLVIPLSIKGIGTTMWSPSELRVIDFGHQMTNTECEWRCTLENKGKRPQVLSWVNKSAKLASDTRSSISSTKRTGVSNPKKPSDAAAITVTESSNNTNRYRDVNSSRNADDDERLPVFSVFPCTIELKPRTACVFVFKGLSLVAGSVREELVCETRVGKEKANKIAFVTEIRGNFMDPKLIPSSPSLAFEYVHEPKLGNEIPRQSQPLSFTNGCELPLSFTLRTQAPFSLDCWEAVLQPNEKLDLNVEFYPGYKDDQTCRVINGKVLIVYTGHPQKDTVDLVGDISFPNIEFESSKIDFGCILNDTQNSIRINIKNVSKVNTAFRWVFIENEQESRNNATSKKPYIPINQVFDILPICGLLRPSESEVVEFIYYGHANRKFKSTVVCEVEGGPEYELILSGEASSLVYKLDKQCLDFGQVVYNKVEDREFSIINVGKVPFAFNIATDMISQRGGRSVEVTPTSGKIAPNDKLKILVRIKPGIPEQFDETILLEIAHFQPMEFKLYGSGIFASVLINLPRENHAACTIQGEYPNWKELKKHARQSIEMSTMTAAMAAGINSKSMSSSDSKSTISTTVKGLEKNNGTGSSSSIPLSSVGKSVTRPANSIVRGHGNSMLNSVAQIDNLDIEIEACRLFFADYLLVHGMRKLETKSPDRLDGLPVPHTEDIRNEKVLSKGNTISIKTIKKRAPESLSFVLSQFVLDFGNVILGTHKIKKFSVTNIGHLPASFQFDKNLALSSGFQIEPERVVRLPEKQAIEFSVTFQARKSNDMGLHEVQLPVVMKNGPPCIVTIRAMVTVPDISISTEILDFGKITVSTCHTVFTQLQNISVVPAEWAIKKPMGSIKDVMNFRIAPQQGVLAPGHKVNLKVEFIPSDGRLYMVKLPVKVTANPKTRSITCKGEGSELRLSFHPPVVDLGPILPCSSPAEVIVEMRNTSDYPVEVFSLDFDPNYKKDEELLRSLNAYDPEGMMQLPIYTPGQPLYDYLSTCGLLPTETVKAPDAPLAEDEVETNVLSQDETVDSFVDPATEATSADPVLISEPPAAHVRRGTDYILLGPPRCGKSTQAQLLAEKENITVWTIDDAIKSVFVDQSPIGQATRIALGLEETTEDSQVESSEEIAVKSEALTNYPHVATSESPETEEGNQAPIDDALLGDKHSAPLAALLDQILVWRMSQPDLRAGGVLDGFDNSFVPFDATVKACAKIFSSARIIWLNFDEESYELMSAFIEELEANTKPISILPTSSSKENAIAMSSMDHIVHGANHVDSDEMDSATPEVGKPIDLGNNASEPSQTIIGADQPLSLNISQIERSVHEMKLEELISRADITSEMRPKSFMEYLDSLESRRRQVITFLVHDLNADQSDGRQELNTKIYNDQDLLEQQQKDRTAPNNFLLNIPITEPGAPLLIHTLIHSSLDKFVREFEATHLPIPLPAKYQLIRRPTERFARKPVVRFSLSAPSEANGYQSASADMNRISMRSDEIEAESINPVVKPVSSNLPGYRWVIPPNEIAPLAIRFASCDVGVFDCSLGFEIVGVRREFTLFCRAICSVPTINVDPRNVFMHRVKSRPEGQFVQKKYVLSRNQFEFGPLIVSTQSVKPPETEVEFLEYQKSSPQNMEIFRMSNNSKFPLRIDFAMEKNVDHTFAVYPPCLDVGEGETGEVKVWAYPPTDGLHENNLVCCISDNPEPVVFAVSCYGCTPKLTLRGPWEQPSAISTSETKDHQLADANIQEQTVSPILDFEQLLLKKQDDKTFFLENESPVAICWRFVNITELPSDFRVFPVDGQIKAFQKAPVLAVFTATNEAIHRFELKVEYSAAESGFQIEEQNRVISIILSAEAYKIDVCSFEQDNTELGDASGINNRSGDGSIDFGLVRVGERHSRAFTIRNKGKYNIKYVISIRTPASKEYFQVEPTEMILEPSKVATVNVFFQSKNEVTLKECKDIKCTIIEMISGEPCREFYVFTSARAVFSQFRLQPNRGINFGPHKYNEQPKPKRIEIRNDGEFPFKYRIKASFTTLAEAEAQEPPLTSESTLYPSTLNVGQFSISPDCGTIDPGVTVGLEVVFQPKNCRVYQEVVCIDISGRNILNSTEADLLHYELIGESCYPSINTTNYESIFEEQIVVRTIGVESSMTSSSGTGALGAIGYQHVVFAENEKMFSFGAVIAGIHAKGTVERFKISNPTKVSTTVQFQIIPDLNSKNSTLGMSDGNTVIQAFTVQPAVWEIPPLEHRFVSVYFKPTTIASYHAIFNATVDDSPEQSDPQDTRLQFQLRGEGTMPCITVIDPIQRDPEGALHLNFGRIRLSKGKELPLTLRNDGILAATVLFTIQSNPNFIFSLANGSVIIPPKETESLSIQFKPQKSHEEPTTCILKIAVQNNPFDETIVKLTGVGYKEDLTFEDLPFGHDDELHFDDILLQALATDKDRSNSDVKDVKVFSLCNPSNEVVRFEWSKMPPFHFSPKIGHLKPRSYKLITAEFVPSTTNAVVYNLHRVSLHAQRIRYRDSSLMEHTSDWDENIRTVTFQAERGTGETLKEPEYDPVGISSTITLNCFAAADVPAYTCDTTTIKFRRTFMLQVCSHRITVVNKSKIKLPFTWRWERVYPHHDLGGGEYFTASAGIDADDECPFEIDPKSGCIPADATETFTIKFAPMEVDDFHYNLVFDGPPGYQHHHDTENLTALRIYVEGSSLRPACHFDVELSDYAQRRAPNHVGPNGELGPLDPSIKVIEMESLGVRVRNTRRFYVVNPTNVSYEFSWTPESETNPCFRCATPRGLMLAGKRCEMIFEFTPQQLELQEMFWRFKIPHFQVSQLFLFVGTTTEPRVTLDRGSVNFNTLLTGTKASQSVALVNQEHIPFNFVFDKASLDFASEIPALVIHPLSGVIPPNGRTAIEIEFMPTEEKMYNFNVNCIIKRKPTRLSLNIKGEGHSIHDALVISSDDHSETRPALLGSGNILDFGAVRMNEDSQRMITIHNSGKFNFEFNWSMMKQAPALSIEPMQGTVKKNDKVICRLTFAPTKQSSVDGQQITCTIAGSKNYVFTVHGTAVPPSLQFSFTSYDFGPCFIAEPDALPMSETALLNIFNMDPDAGVDVDCLLEKKPHLRVDCPPMVLGPRESVNIPIIFTARAEISYLDMVPFTINGSSTVTIAIRGEGIFPKVELVNTSMRSISFGNLQIQQQASRTVKIVNRSKRKTLVKILDSPQPGVPLLSQLSISVFPQQEVMLRPKESTDIEFKFFPTQRIPSFVSDVYMAVAGSEKKLLTLSGCCQGMEVILDTDTLLFGTVCLGSQLVRKVRLQNRGDITAKFQWNPRDFTPDFSISPSEGMVAPNHHKILEVTFKPSAVNADIRYDHLACAIEGTTPVLLTLVGSCALQAPSSIQDIHFSSRVRETTTKSIIIENKTTLPWNLFPVVQGEHWSCPENITVPAESQATMDIIYHPLKMTSEKQNDDFNRPETHEGSIFFALPDGGALLYNVYGKASSPLSAGSLTLTTSAKKYLPITIPLNNWLKAPQTFVVEIKKPAENDSIITQGPTSIMLHSGVTRPYNLKFFSYTEGEVNLQVRFMNMENGEYLVFDVNVTVMKAAEIETLHLEAPVRQSIRKILTIENPFDASRVIHFVDKNQWWKCTSSTIRVRQVNSISGRPEGSYEIEYRPFIHVEATVEASLTIAFAELGEYTYKLMLTTQPAGIDKVLHFKVPLGSSETQTFTFTSYADKAADMACTVLQSTFFSVPPLCRVEASSEWEGNVYSVPVKFEPEALGEVRDTLTLFADSVGDYKCALQGLSVPPLPQGPFIFANSKDIEFKNVFSSTKDFDVMVDNSLFLLSAQTITIPAKTAKTISIKVDIAAAAASTSSTGKATQGVNNITGKLFISCPSMQTFPPWVYYLEATLPSM